MQFTVYCLLLLVYWCFSGEGTKKGPANGVFKDLAEKTTLSVYLRHRTETVRMCNKALSNSLSVKANHKDMSTDHNLISSNQTQL